jgi:hypothetical protein
VTDDDLSPELIQRLRDSIKKYAAVRGITWGEAFDDYARLMDYVHEFFRAHIEDGEALPVWLASAVEQAEREMEQQPCRLKWSNSAPC